MFFDIGLKCPFECEQDYLLLFKAQIRKGSLWISKILTRHSKHKPPLSLLCSASEVTPGTHVEDGEANGRTTARWRTTRQVDECKSAYCSIRMSAREWSVHGVQFVCWAGRAATAGSGTLWSSGCLNLRPRRVRRWWEPVPAGRTAGLLMCWCTRGTSRCHRTPEWQTYVKSGSCLRLLSG